MKQIILTKNLVALIDDEDYTKVNQYTWYAHESKLGQYYAATRTGGVFQYMHRLILGLSKDCKAQVDHKNSNKLDNQKDNIRVCNQSKNNANNNKRKSGTSKYKGVMWAGWAKQWRVQVAGEGKYFKDEIEAAKFYDVKAKELYGEFARINF